MKLVYDSQTGYRPCGYTGHVFHLPKYMASDFQSMVKRNCIKPSALSIVTDWFGRPICVMSLTTGDTESGSTCFEALANLSTFHYLKVKCRNAEGYFASCLLSRPHVLLPPNFFWFNIKLNYPALNKKKFEGSTFLKGKKLTHTVGLACNNRTVFLYFNKLTHSSSTCHTFFMCIDRFTDWQQQHMHSPSTRINIRTTMAAIMLVIIARC